MDDTAHCTLHTAHRTAQHVHQHTQHTAMIHINTAALLVSHSRRVTQPSRTQQSVRSIQMSAVSNTELPSLPDAIDDATDGDLTSFKGTLVRLGDAAGNSPAVRVQLVADGVLVHIAQLLRQRSEWLLRQITNESNGELSLQVDVLAHCLRVCGNSCIDCDAARDALLQHATLSSILTCLRYTARVDVLKFAAGALANLICAHEAAQEAFMDNHSTAVIVPALNNAMSATALPRYTLHRAVIFRD